MITAVLARERIASGFYRPSINPTPLDVTVDRLFDVLTAEPPRKDSLTMPKEGNTGAKPQDLIDTARSQAKHMAEEATRLWSLLGERSAGSIERLQVQRIRCCKHLSRLINQIGRDLDRAHGAQPVDDLAAPDLRFCPDPDQVVQEGGYFDFEMGHAGTVTLDGVEVDEAVRCMTGRRGWVEFWDRTADGLPDHIERKRGHVLFIPTPPL